jgi:GNAT superfamily N-acetyltransferase
MAIHGAHRGDPARDTTAAELATWQAMRSMSGLFVFVAFLDSIPAGTATLTLLPNITYQCAPSAIVEAVVVGPQFRRLGIGTALMHRCIQQADMLGVDKIQLLSHKRHQHDGGHDLYRSTGFTAEAEGFRLYVRSGAARASSS